MINPILKQKIKPFTIKLNVFKIIRLNLDDNFFYPNGDNYTGKNISYSNHKDKFRKCLIQK